MVARNLAPVYAEPDAASRVVDYLPAGTALPTRYGRFLFTPQGWVSFDDAVEEADLPPSPPGPDDLVAAARAFLGVPYLWGGTTARGLDCSGLVQQAYRLCGVLLPRDAHQQATLGHVVDEPEAGDLVFSGRPIITHVGMALPGARRMIHASQARRHVVEEEIAARSEPVAARRYLR